MDSSSWIPVGWRSGLDVMEAHALWERLAGAARRRNERSAHCSWVSRSCSCSWVLRERCSVRRAESAATWDSSARKRESEADGEATGTGATTDEAAAEGRAAPDARASEPGRWEEEDDADSAAGVVENVEARGALGKKAEIPPRGAFLEAVEEDEDAAEGFTPAGGQMPRRRKSRKHLHGAAGQAAGEGEFMHPQGSQRKPQGGLKEEPAPEEEVSLPPPSGLRRRVHHGPHWPTRSAPQTSMGGVAEEHGT